MLYLVKIAASSLLNRLCGAIKESMVSLIPFRVNNEPRLITAFPLDVMSFIDLNIVLCYNYKYCLMIFIIKILKLYYREQEVSYD